MRRANERKRKEKFNEEHPVIQGKHKSDLRVNQAIRDIIERVADENSTIKTIADDVRALGIINKAEFNRFLNVYINGAAQSLEQLQKFNNNLFDKVVKKKKLLTGTDHINTYLKIKELENQQMRILSELTKTQHIELDQTEREMIIIYRSIPPELKQYLFETILGFVKSCPEIQRAMLETNQRLKSQDQLAKE